MSEDLRDRVSPIDLSADEFRRAGHVLIDDLADLLEGIRDRPVTPGDDPSAVWERLGPRDLPEDGRPTIDIVTEAFEVLRDGSLFNGHPKFFGYITASAAPIGILGDLLAAGINPNTGGWPLSPTASAIELQTVDWIAQLIGYPTPCGGLLCSGGNVANMLCFWAARRWKVGEKVRQLGIGDRRLTAYASSATHTWLQKASDLSGLGTDAVRMVEVGDDERMKVDELRRMIEEDIKDGAEPFIVVASGGTVSTGAIDPILKIAELCKEKGVWLHVDGAYGAFAAALPEADPDLKALAVADSIALDPHKWLYAPMEAGCALVRDRQLLYDAFLFRPPYYRFDEHKDGDWVNFFELGIQNSRGFRALKVWMALQQAGRNGYVESIRQDIALAKAIAEAAEQAPDIEFRSQRLSIVVYRYVPTDLQPGEGTKSYLNDLNEEILRRMQAGGEVFLSNAVSEGDYLLRACVVNFRTQLADALAAITVAQRLGQEIDREMRPAKLR